MNHRDNPSNSGPTARSHQRRTLAKLILPFAGNIFELMFGIHGLRAAVKRSVCGAMGIATSEEAARLQDRIDRLHGAIRALARRREVLPIAASAGDRHRTTTNRRQQRM